MWSRRAALGVAATIVAVAIGVSPVAYADDGASANDRAYLAAVNHGTLCCPGDPDTPIAAGSPANQIQVGKSTAEYMTAFPTFRAFQDVAKLNQQKLGLNPYAASQLVAIAMRFYAAPAVESQVRAQMGDRAGQWYPG